MGSARLPRYRRRPVANSIVLVTTAAPASRAARFSDVIEPLPLRCLEPAPVPRNIRRSPETRKSSVGALIETPTAAYP